MLFIVFFSGWNRKAWIYYKNRKASPGTRANAALEIQSLLEPEKKHILKIQQEQHVEEDNEGDPR